MRNAVAVIGMACRYPDAKSPQELWENSLAQRRAFRRIPPERLRLEDYLSDDRRAPDRIYMGEAALIEGYEFDRVRYHVMGSTYRTADLTHWLALDVAAEALQNSGVVIEGAARETTGVIVGNTLTGEFTRAGLMRVRWPYVRRNVEAALQEEGWEPDRRAHFLEVLEQRYKHPFPEVSEESLAGGLSNTIAGRICNYFDFQGGGYTVDGACASSLLALATACSALEAGDLDVVVAGGVDLSIDPFELVGFAKTGALAAEEMRVFDVRSAGFWPGEGCGFAVLMRYEDAVAQARTIHAVIRGWGVSSDGSGGITRPEVAGQMVALRKAYRRAGFGIDTVTYFECHGTGTSVGDATELEALTRARRDADETAAPAIVGSIKATIGHTKAAAGMAGFFNAAMALQHRTLPPQSGCEQPHPLVNGESTMLRVLQEAEPWPAARPLRAGVSGMGFGGINAHLVLEGVSDGLRNDRPSTAQRPLSSLQDAELFLLAEATPTALLATVDHLLTFASRISRAEMGDLACALAARAEGAPGPSRAALVAVRPAQLQDRLLALRNHLVRSREPVLDSKGGWFFHPEASGKKRNRIGFLFPGQGVPLHADGGLWRRRFASVKARYARADLPTPSGSTGTEAAQPIIVTACLAALDLVGAVGITADVALGHSLGELVALHWADVFDEQAVLRIARARGRAMASVSGPRGAMASLSASAEEVRGLCAGTGAVIAGLNSSQQTVISGKADEIASVVQCALARGWQSVMLPVSHAFHSPLMEEAVPLLREALRADTPAPLHRAVLSTVTGTPLSKETDVTALLCAQLTGPVRFSEAFAAAQAGIDLWLELGPGQVLTGLAAGMTSAPIIALHAGGESLRGLLLGVGACFVLGAVSYPAALYTDRFVRPFPWNWQPRFFQNPCELAPILSAKAPEAVSRGTAFEEAPPTPSLPPHEAPLGSARENRQGDLGSTLEAIRQLVAERTELPVAAIAGEHRFLSDLHLNSITVGELMVRAAREVGVPVPSMPLDFADATLADAARMLDESEHNGGMSADERDSLSPAGVAPWVESFTVEWVETPLQNVRPPTERGIWHVFAPESCRWAESVRIAFAAAPSGGVVVCMPAALTYDSVDLLLASARALFAQEKPERYVVVQEGCSGAPFARTLSLEHSGIATCVVDVPWDHPEAATFVVREALAAEGFREARYDLEGVRHEPRLRHLPPKPKAGMTLGSNDVLLVSGGGKGIAAECALALAQRTGTRLLLLGRADPHVDAELARNLARLADAGASVHYARADVTNSAQVESALQEAQAEIGPVTAILHGAGRNVPCPIRDLTAEAFHLTLATKVTGLQNILAAINSKALRLLVSFGSIIARTGLQGEADYAVANARLTSFVEEWQRDHADCRCLNLEWSVWAGAGMAERMGRVEALTRQGIMPISIEDGTAQLVHLLEQPANAISYVVTGRFGSIPTLTCEEASLPFQRFLERPRVYYPDVELVVDSVLSADSDPYLSDHIFARERLMPGVMALEAAAQVAMALARSATPPRFENVRFLRPTVVPENQAVTLRVAALQRTPGRIEIAIRSDATSFQADHVRLTCRFDAPVEAREPGELERSPLLDLREQLSSRSGSELYGPLLFQTGRFRRLKGYRLLRAKECVAEIGAAVEAPWFGPYLPTALVLGDVGARDAAIHLIQACIPHATLLPIGIDRLTLGQTPLAAPCIALARETSQEGDLFTYDLTLYDREGRPCESWQGLHLRRVADRNPAETWPELLVGPYVERMLAAHLPPSQEIGAILTSSGSDRSEDNTEQALTQLLGRPIQVRRRPDGKPETEGGLTVSSAHSGSLTFAVAGAGALSCDAEAVVHRPVGVWQDLLGAVGMTLAQRIVHETGADLDQAATRVWAANECAKKLGRRHSSLVLEAATVPDWVRFSSGDLHIATYACHVSTRSERLVLAVATEC